MHVDCAASRIDLGDEGQIDAIGKKPAASEVAGVAGVTCISGIARVSGVAGITRVAGHDLYPPFCIRPRRAAIRGKPQHRGELHLVPVGDVNCLTLASFSPEDPTT